MKRRSLDLNEDVIDVGWCAGGCAVLGKSAIGLYSCGRVLESLRRAKSSLDDDGWNVALHVRPGSSTCVVVTESGALLCYTIDSGGSSSIRYGQTVRLRTKPDLLAVTHSDIWFCSRGDTELRRIPWSSTAGSARSEHVSLSKPVRALYTCGDTVAYMDDTGHVLGGEDLGAFDALCYGPIATVAGKMLHCQGATIELPFEAYGVERSTCGTMFVVCHSAGCAVVSRTGTLLNEFDIDCPRRAIFGNDDSSLIVHQADRLVEVELWSAVPFSQLVRRERGVVIRLRTGWYHVELPQARRPLVAALDNDRSLAVVTNTVSVLCLQTGHWSELDFEDDDEPGRCTHLVWLGECLVVATVCADGETRLLLYDGDLLLDVVALPARLALLHAAEDVLYVALDSAVLYLLQIRSGILTKIRETPMEHDVQVLKQVTLYRDSLVYLVGQQLYLEQSCIANGVDAFAVEDGDLWMLGRGKLGLLDPDATELLSLECRGVPLTIVDDAVEFFTGSLSVETRLVAPARLCAELRLGRDRQRLKNRIDRSHVLEVALHEALEADDEKLVRKVWLQVKAFCEEVQVLQSLLRKTDAALWRRLFGIVGPPDDLYSAAVSRGDYRAACNLVLAVITVGRGDASAVVADLLRKVIAAHDHRLAKELLRFVKSSDVLGADIFAQIDVQ